MMKGIALLAGLVVLGGCATTNVSHEPLSGLDRPAAAPVDIGVDWAWRTVGDAAVRPVQVFSLNGVTYVQMKDGRPVVILSDGEVAYYDIKPPYLAVQGLPSRLDIVSDGYRAVAERTFVQSAPVTVASRAEIMPQDSPVITAHPAEANNNRIERVVIR